MAEEINQTQKSVQEVMAKLGDAVPPEAKSRIEEAVKEIIEHDVLPRIALGLPPEMFEAMYQQGYNLFQSGKYQDALTIFNVLRFLDISDGRYTFSIAACYHYMQEYLDAAANYLIYREMDPLNPITSFHLYDCFVKADYPASALFFIQEALVLAGMDPQYDALKEKIQLEANQFNGVLKKHFEEKYGSAGV